MKLKIPENKEELQRFLGMTTYLSKFIPNYSQTSAPLRTLLEKDCEWHWEEQNVAFSALKRGKFCVIYTLHVYFQFLRVY